MKKKTKIIIGISGALLLVGITTFAVIQLRDGSEASEPPPLYTTVPVGWGDVTRTVSAPGELVLTETDTIQSPATLELVELLVKPGEQVTKGNILARFDTESLELAVEEAYQAYAEACDRYGQAEDPEEEAAAYQQMIRAYQEYERAKEELGKATVYAPCDGMVLDVKARVGDIVPAFSPVIVLADLSKLEMVVTVDQHDIMSIEADMPADVYLDALPGTTLEGKVDYVVPQKSATSQIPTYEVYLSIEEMPEGPLPGMTGDATIVLAEKHDVLRLPRRLVRVAPDGSGRVEVLEGGEPVMRTVEVGLQGDLYVEIISGLSEGDLVVQWGR